MGTFKVKYDSNLTTDENLQVFMPAFNRWSGHLDSKNVKFIDTNETTIKSADGSTYINGPVIEQKDANGNLRLKQGLDSALGLFVFQMFNLLGIKTIEIDNNGNIIVNTGKFKGNIETTEDAIVGKNITLGNLNETNTAKQIRFFGTAPNYKATINVQDISGAAIMGLSATAINLNATAGDLNIASSGTINLQATSIKNIGNQEMATQYYVDQEIENAIGLLQSWVDQNFARKA